LNTVLRQARFLSSAVDLGHAPADQGAEVAFIGRSNSGKSSAINAITQQSKLARVSKTPGRTQQLIFFEVDGQRRLVDLPGYGYADVPQAVQRDWSRFVEDYLRERESLKGLVVIVDSRRGLMELDEAMLTWCAQAQVPAHILLSKCDKLNLGPAKQILLETQKRLTQHSWEATVQLFSAQKNTGVGEAQKQVSHWLGLK
jgi:GTP-binding protein